VSSPLTPSFLPTPRRWRRYPSGSTTRRRRSNGSIAGCEPTPRTHSCSIFRNACPEPSALRHSRETSLDPKPGHQLVQSLTADAELGRRARPMTTGAHERGSHEGLLERSPRRRQPPDVTSRPTREVWRKRARRDDSALLAPNREGRQNVLQLADVAGPVVRAQ